MNTAKPSQFCSPRTPATAPAKHEERNLTVYTRELLYCTLGGKSSCAACSGVGVAMVVVGREATICDAAVAHASVTLLGHTRVGCA